ncbi:MAG: hypothetical protein M3N59_03120 [bacterium]|nr:hypothetical protein [bacterium]
MTIRVLFAGMDGVGKSTLACSVYRTLRLWGYDVGLHEIDVWSDTHGPILGRKPWVERQKRGNDVRNYLADEFSAAVGRFVSDERHELVLGDLHGRWQMPDPPYWDGLAADRAVLVVRHPTAKDGQVVCPQREDDWRRFLATWRIPVSARVCSLLPGQQPLPDSLPVWNLDRELRDTAPDVCRIAAHVADWLP